MRRSGSAPPPAPEGPPAHAVARGEVVAALRSDEASGLAAAEVARRLAEHGPNRPTAAGRPSYPVLALRQFADPLVALLVAAAAISATIGDGLEAAVIGAIVALNAALGFGQEAAAERAMHALRSVFTHRASVVRDGSEREIPAEEVVPGDLLVLREGERVAADGRILAGERLAVDESALTGESVPSEKGAAPVAASAPLADRSSMVFAGTAVTRGRGTAVVTATGDATEVGRVTRLAAEAKPPPTPLQRRLGGLSGTMVVVGALITVALTVAMLGRGSSFHEAFLVGVAVAVAAVPEGLAATVTVALALGAREMAARGAIVRRLSAIETVGETTVICTDKTGTLTENRLRLAEALPAEGVDEHELLAAAVLASSAELLESEDGVVRVAGDPVDGALLLAAMERGLSRDDLLEERRHVHEVPFEAERKRMTVVYEEPAGGLRAFSKGAPEVLLARAAGGPAELGALERRAHSWAGKGLRVLAVAERELPAGTALGGDLEQRLRLLGLVAIHDPLRASAPAAVREAREAGVAVKMLTGDHPETALAIGHALGLAAEDVFARVTPEEKLRLVEELQAAGEVVAVTGDGVNDAPALRRADVGIAMGRSGTEAAREAAAIVLTDDDFATIVAALREGRRIADNVRKVVAFLLSANFGEVVLFAVAVLAGLGAPMTVVQVLTINILTDGVPAVALARDPASNETMALGPRNRARLVPRPLALALAAVGVLVGVAGLGAYLLGRGIAPDAAKTMAFTTIAVAELAFVFSCRSVEEAAWRVPANRHLIGGVLLSLALLAATLYVPPLHEPFGTVSLGPVELAAAVALATVPFLAVELGKWLRRRRV